MGDLIAFLNARVNEDEAAATAATGTAWAWEATGDKDNSWAVGHVEGEDGRPLSGEIEHGQGIVIDGVCESINGSLADAAHIARHDPARVLREVEAARRILERHRPRMLDRWQVCSNCRPIDPDHPADSTSVLWPCPDFRDLLVRWADHPDYRQEWKP